MAHAKHGDKVIFHYSATLEDGTVFDSTYEDVCEDDDCDCEGESGPMEITIGSKEFFPEIEQALIGMAVGEKKSVLIPSADAFGEYDPEKVFSAKRSEIPEDLQPEVGDAFTLANDNDEEIDVTVVEVSADSVTFDSNHPLAGEDLKFDIELIEIL
ncbi:MAG: peptidylprolyl isomerase [Desulfuromonadales bacterium]|nr:peptidylprolyl isomerase [Desulfuromonadales bacterium]